MFNLCSLDFYHYRIIINWFLFKTKGLSVDIRGGGGISFGDRIHISRSTLNKDFFQTLANADIFFTEIHIPNGYDIYIYIFFFFIEARLYFFLPNNPSQGIKKLPFPHGHQITSP